MPDYRISIIVDGKDNASGMLNGIGGGLGSIATIAGGILSAGFIEQIGQGIADIATYAFDAVGQIQMLTMGLESLAAAELVRNSAVTTSQTFASKATDEQIARQQWLNAEIDKQSQKLAGLDAGSDAYVSQQNKIKGLAQEVHNLGISQDGLVYNTISSTETTKSFTDVLGQAKPVAQELLGWIRDLSIKSPFQYTQVADTLRFQASMGQTLETSKLTTKAILDFSAASGLTGDEMNRFSYALAQTGAAGKITAMDMRQFANSRFGLDQLNNVFATLSKNTGVAVTDHLAFNDAIEKGKITTDDFFQAFSQSVDQQFGGAAGRMTGTLEGIKNNLADIKFFAATDIFGPLGDRAANILSPMINGLAASVAGGRFKEIGQQILGVFDRVSGISMGDIGAMFSSLIPPQILSALPYLQMGFQNFSTFAQTQGPLIMASLGSAFTQIGGYLTNLATYIVPWLLSTFNQVSVWFVANGPLITTFIGSIGQAFANIIGAVTTMWMIIQPLVSGAVAVILSLATTIMAAFTGNWSLAWASFTSAVTSLVSGISGAFLGLANWITGTFFGTTWPNVLANWRSNWDMLGVIVTTLWEKIKTIFTNFANKFTDIGKSIITGLIGGIKSSAQQLYDIITGIIQKAIKDAMSILGIKSPSRVFADMGYQIPAGLAVGISGGFGVANNALAGGINRMVAGATTNNNDQRVIYYGPVNNYYAGDPAQNDLLRSKR